MVTNIKIKKCYSEKDYVDLTFYDGKKEIKMQLRATLYSKYDGHRCFKEFNFSDQINIPIEKYKEDMQKNLILDKAY